MKKFILIIFYILMFSLLFNCTPNEEEQKPPNIPNSTTMQVIIGEKAFIAELQNNESVTALIKILPLKILMSELNQNEKFYFLESNLPTNSQSVDMIQAGDIMLYGSNCLVLFYETFKTSYSYTKIGHIQDVRDLKMFLGKGSIMVNFKFK